MLRLLVLPHICLALVHAYAFGLGSPARYTNPTFDAAKTIAPMPMWGLMFFLGACALTAALILNDDFFTVAALFAGGFMYTWWALLLGAQTFIVGDPAASLIGPGLYLWVGFMHFTGAWRARVRMA